MIVHLFVLIDLFSRESSVDISHFQMYIINYNKKNLHIVYTKITKIIISFSPVNF